jgi:hypothetical protein
MTERMAVNKPSPRPARPLGAFLKAGFGETFTRRGFASAELVTRWTDIVGPEIAAHTEPARIKWPRDQDDAGNPATLVLRVEGPRALEIQHLSGVILDRVNRFFGWHAIGRLALRQGPLSRRRKEAPPTPDAERAARIALTLGEVKNDALRQALARLGAAIKRA